MKRILLAFAVPVLVITGCAWRAGRADCGDSDDNSGSFASEGNRYAASAIGRAASAADHPSRHPLHPSHQRPSLRRIVTRRTNRAYPSSAT